MNNRMLKVLFAMVFCTEFIFVGFGSEDSVSSSLSSPITANLSISKIPLINETTNLYCKVVAYSDAPNTTTEITLPEGIELVSGHLTGQWDLEADVPVYLNATIKFSKTGDFKIQAIARRVIDEKTFWGDTANIYLTIGNKSSHFTPPPIWAYYPAIQISPGKAQRVEVISEIIPIDPHTLPQSNELPVSSKNLSTINSSQSSKLANYDLNENITGPTNPGALIVTGRWYYWGQDSNYKTTPNAWLPAKSFLVGIVKASDNTFLGMGYTKENGDFSIQITNPGSDGFKISLWIYNQYPNGEEMRVIMDTAYTGLEGLTGVYGWTTGKITSADGTFDVGGLSLPTTDNKYRACWLLNDLNRANRYFSSHSGGVASQGTIAWWPENTGVNGKGNAVYTWGGQINIPGGLEVSSHVVMHEYGHNIMYRRYGDYTPYSSLCNCGTCTTHIWTNCYDEECGWTEGWADFFCCCPDNDPVYKDPRFSPINFESATPGNGWCTGPTCEARVCGALWDIFDTANDGLDTYSWGFGPIANVFIGGTQDTFADFWTQWQSKGYSTDASNCLLQNTIDLPVSGWNALGGYVTSSPSIVVDNAGKTEAWVRGGDNALWVNIDGTWRGKGGVLASDPFAAIDYNGKVHVLVRGSDNAAWDFIYNPQTSVGQWKYLGGIIKDGPTAAMEPTKHEIMKVATRGADNALWYCDLYINTGAIQWYTTGGVLASAPYVIFDPSGIEHTFVRGADNALWDNRGAIGIDGQYHFAWNYFGGVLASGPTASIEPGNTKKVAAFVKGSDNALWMCDVNSANAPETCNWYGLGGVISSVPFAVADTSANRIHVFVRGGDSLWENIFTTSPWSPGGNHWQMIGGLIRTYTPGAIIRGNTQAFVIGTDNALWRNTHATFSAASSGGGKPPKQEEPHQVNYPARDPNAGGGKS